MIIKKIKTRRNGVLLNFDNFDDVILNKDVFNKSMLSVGIDISEDELEKLILLSSEIDVKTKALQLLTRRSHSALELKNKLLKRNFGADIISKILIQLEERNYLDDENFAFLFAEEKITKKKQSLNKVKADLFQRGISKQIIDEIIEKYQDDEIILKNIKYLADKKLSFLQHKYSDNEVLKHKIVEYLFRKGYEFEKIKLVIK